MTKRLFLLDAFALIYRAHFAFIKNPLINSKGMDTSCITGFVNTILHIVESEKPTHLAVGFDLPTPTFRHESFPEYKANRDAQPEAITEAVPIIKEILEAWNIPILFAEGFEADDVIGTIAHKAEAEGFEVFMVTPDKDYGQLVTSNIKMYKPAKGKDAAEIWGVQEVCEYWRINTPIQVIDILGLQGDAVDNIPGVPGIGPKTAATLIEKFESVENILQNTNQLQGKVKEALENNKEKALLSKQLATIELHVPVTFNAEDCAYDGPNTEKLIDIFKYLEFRSISSKILALYPDKNNQKVTEATQFDLFGNPINTPTPPPVRERVGITHNIKNTKHNYLTLNTPEEVAKLAQTLNQKTEFAIDTETTDLNPSLAELVGISIAFQANEAYYIPIPADRQKAQLLIEALRPPIENENIAKIGQNIKFDLLVFKHYGLLMVGKLKDTMLMHYLLEPDKRHNMNYMAESLLDYSPISIEALIGKGKGQLNMRDIDIERISQYAAEDADITLQLKNALEPKLDESITKLYNTMEEPLLKVLAEMEAEGVKLDIPFLEDYSIVLETEIQELQTKIYRDAGVTAINLNSPSQVGELLFDRLKVPYRWKKNANGSYSTEEDKLAELALTFPIINDILSYRSLQKLKNTYVDALPKMVNPTTLRIHTSFNQALTQTGRLSSQNPNLQNIPVRTEKGREIRKAFVAKDPDHVILSADYSQIELRLIAEIAKDDAMLEAFTQGLDIHTATAAKVYQVPLEEVTKEQRYNAKTINFSIIYGAGAQNLSRQLGIKAAEAKKLIESYFEQYKGLKTYMSATIAQAREDGFVTTLMGRKRFLRDINSRNQLARSNEERMAINTPIQGSAADMIKMAMINIHNRLREQQLKTRLILQVHDELLLDVPKNEIEQVKTILSHEMKNAIPNLSVPIEISMGIGNNWLEAH
jgi:DNA polymerase-1